MNAGAEAAIDGDDLHSALEGAFEEHENASVEDAPVEPAEEAAEDGRKRDDKGRFAKAEESEEAAEPAVEIEEQPEAAVEEDKAEDGEEKAERIAPPAHWNGAAKVRWEKLPQRVQEAIVSDYAEKEVTDQRLGAFEQVLQPYKQQLSLRFGDDINGVKTMLEYADALEKDAAGTLQYLAKQYGVDFTQLAGVQHGEHMGHVDPNYAALERQNQELQQKLNALEGMVQQQQQNPIKQQIDAFASDPRYPYFNDVRVTMGALIEAAHQTGKNLTMEQAYEMAVNADPTIRSEMDAERREREAAAKAKKLQDAKDAQTIKGAPAAGGHVGAVQSENLRDVLDEAWNTHI